MTTQPGPARGGPGGPDQTLSAVMSERRQLINLSYRLLGSLAEAEDAVQETYTRWYAMSAEQRQAIESPGGWLTTVASRVCLDLLGSARARRELYVGEWLPEPLPAPAEQPATADPADRITLDESVTMAFLVVLETMTPAERVAFVLHDVFRYPFADVAEIVGRTPAACRQLASSARRRVRASGTATTQAAQRASAARNAVVVRDFKAAWEAKDIGALIGLLDPGATAVADGGGLVSAARRPVEGGEQVARYLAGVLGQTPGLTIAEAAVNGLPGLIARQDGATVTVFAFDIAADQITRIWIIRNPNKLTRWPDHAR
jgi:RNA polymerase sigma factor (sigma-70 family)